MRTENRFSAQHDRSGSIVGRFRIRIHSVPIYLVMSKFFLNSTAKIVYFQFSRFIMSIFRWFFLSPFNSYFGAKENLCFQIFWNKLSAQIGLPKCLFQNSSFFQAMFFSQIFCVWKICVLCPFLLVDHVYHPTLLLVRIVDLKYKKMFNYYLNFCEKEIDAQLFLL